ncbi:MAG: hypothetical protein M1812_008140 [Candelaria pacifica]|nr:MAG: hypothetical protein M1812_008140 [Candelaria pacifica]
MVAERGEESVVRRDTPLLIQPPARISSFSSPFSSRLYSTGSRKNRGAHTYALDILPHLQSFEIPIYTHLQLLHVPRHGSVNLVQLQPQLCARVEAAGATRYGALQCVAVAVGGRQDEEKVIVEGATDSTEGVEGGCGRGQEVEVVRGGVEEEEAGEAGWQIGGHEPGVELVNGSGGGEDGVRVLGHDLFAQRDAAKLVLVDLD